jgi:hypothetical protein
MYNQGCLGGFAPMPAEMAKENHFIHFQVKFSAYEIRGGLGARGPQPQNPLTRQF